MGRSTTSFPQRANEALRAAIAQEVARRSNATSLITVVGVSFERKRKEVQVSVSVFPEYKTREALAFLQRHARDFARVAAGVLRSRGIRVRFLAPPARETTH